MPSVDSTGKRLSGGAQRQKAAKNNAARAKLAQLAPELAAALPEFAAVAGDSDTASDPHPIVCDEPPPPGEGVDALMRWCNDLQAGAALLAERREDPARVRAVGCVVKALAKMRPQARDSSQLLLALRKYRGQVVAIDTPDPPVERYARAAWAAWRLASILFGVAQTTDEIDEGAVAHVARAYGLLAEVVDQATIDSLTAELADDGEDAG